MSSHVLVDLHDPRTRAIADVLANKTCAKLLSLLAEQELSESELSAKSRVPLNTVHYNMKKLVKAGLVEHVRSLWSAKGRRVAVYRVSEKRIVISPKSFLKGIVPALVISTALAGILRFVSLSQSGSYDSVVSEQAAFASSAAMKVPTSDNLYNFLAAAPNTWAWFLIGALIALVVVFMWNWRKI